MCAMRNQSLPVPQSPKARAHPQQPISTNHQKPKRFSRQPKLLPHNNFQPLCLGVSVVSEVQIRTIPARHTYIEEHLTHASIPAITSTTNAHHKTVAHPDTPK